MRGAPEPAREGNAAVSAGTDTYMTAARAAVRAKVLAAVRATTRALTLAAVSTAFAAVSAALAALAAVSAALAALAAVSAAFTALALALAAAAAAAATANVAAAAHAFWQRADVPLVLRRAILPDAQHQLAATHRQAIKQPGAEAGEKQLGLFRGLCAGCDSVLFAHAAACRPSLHSKTSITAKVQLRKPRGNDIEQGRFGAVRARGCRLAGGILWAAG